MRKFWKREPTVNESADKPSSGNVLKMVTLRNGQFFASMENSTRAIL